MISFREADILDRLDHTKRWVGKNLLLMNDAIDIFRIKSVDEEGMVLETSGFFDTQVGSPIYYGQDNKCVYYCTHELVGRKLYLDGTPTSANPISGSMKVTDRINRVTNGIMYYSGGEQKISDLYVAGYTGLDWGSSWVVFK